MKIEICEETKWTVIFTTIVLAIAFCICFGMYQTKVYQVACVKQRLVEINDTAVSTHFGKP